MLVSGTRTGRSASSASSAAVASAASAGSNVRAAMVCIRTADDRTAEEDDAVHMIGQFASDLANDHPAQLQPTRPTGPCSVATS